MSGPRARQRGAAALLLLAACGLAGWQWSALTGARARAAADPTTPGLSGGGTAPLRFTDAPDALARRHPPLARAWAHRPPTGDAVAAAAHAEAAVSPVLTGRLEEALGVAPALAAAALIPPLDTVLAGACLSGGGGPRCDAAAWHALQERLPQAIDEVLEDPDPAVAAELAVAVCGDPELARSTVASAPPLGAATPQVEGLVLFLERCAGDTARAQAAAAAGPPLAWPAQLLQPDATPPAPQTSLGAALQRMGRAR